jgi:hypothetical protein
MLIVHTTRMTSDSGHDNEITNIVIIISCCLTRKLFYKTQINVAEVGEYMNWASIKWTFV